MILLGCAALSSRNQRTRVSKSEVEENDVRTLEEKDAEKRYVSALVTFTNTLQRSIGISQACAGIDAGPQRFYVSAMYCKLVNTGVSVAVLCPGSKLNENGIHWDFGAVASLVRNLHESTLAMHYLGVDSNSAEEWTFRLKLMQLHDCVERKKMLAQMGVLTSDDETFSEEQATLLRDDLKGNPCFLALTLGQQNELLKGKTDKHLSRIQILAKIGADVEQMSGMYRFLSSETHSYPLSFYRMAEQNRNRGVKSSVELNYIATALEFAETNLTDANEWMRTLFPSVNFDAIEKYELRANNRIFWKAITGRESDSVLVDPVSYD